MEEVERRSAALYKAPRVSLDDIKAAIDCRYDLTADKAVGDAPVADPLKLLSICILVMRNGFTIIGKSAPASPENFDAEYGRQLAYADAIKQVWTLMGFALRDRLARDKADTETFNRVVDA
ncbi:MAG: Gp49 family protein [Solirubrobacteraceae bacterium]